MCRFSLLLESKLRGGVGTVDRTIPAREYTCRQYPERWLLSYIIFVRGVDNKIHDTRLLILKQQSILKFQRSLKSIFCLFVGLYLPTQAILFIAAKLAKFENICHTVLHAKHSNAANRNTATTNLSATVAIS